MHSSIVHMLTLGSNLKGKLEFSCIICTHTFTEPVHVFPCGVCSDKKIVMCGNCPVAIVTLIIVMCCNHHRSFLAVAEGVRNGWCWVRLYRKQLAKVKVARTLSEWFPVKRGCVLSPILVQHPSWDGDEGVSGRISRWTTNRRANDQESGVDFHNFWCYILIAFSTLTLGWALERASGLWEIDW